MGKKQCVGMGVLWLVLSLLTGSALGKEMKIFHPQSNGCAFYMKNGKYGVMNREGAFMTPAQFDEIYPYEDEIGAIVRVDDQYGLIDTEGKIVLEIIYDDLLPSIVDKELVICVCLNGKWGCLKADGTVLIPFEWDDMGGFAEDGYSWMEKNGLRGVLDSKGNVVWQPIWDGSYLPHDGYLLVAFDEGMGYIGTDGNLLGEKIWSNGSRDFSDGRAVVRSEEDYQGWVIDTDGNMITGSQWYDMSDEYSEGLLAVCRKDKKISGLLEHELWGFIDRNGKVVIEPQYQSVGNFSDDRAVVQDLEGKYGYIDRHGTQVIPMQFEYAEDFIRGYAVVQTDAGYRFIDPSGKVLSDIPVQKYATFFDGMACIQKDGEAAGLWGYMNTLGELAIDYQFLSADPFVGGVAIVCYASDDEEIWIDKEGNIILQ